jgi:hypothetical protein
MAADLKEPSEGQASPMTLPTELPDAGLPAATAMDLVLKAHRGEIGHDELVHWLMVWPYEPKYRVLSLADD